MNKKKTIYLAGPILYVDTESANSWRNYVVSKLSNDFLILNPLRRNNFNSSNFQSDNEIIQLDKADILNSDILLVNATEPSVGASMEVLFANMNSKIIITIFNSERKISPWLRYHSTRIETDLDSAIDYISKNFSDI